MKIRCTSSGLGVEAGTKWPVLQDTKTYWIAVICGVEKKIIKSTGLFAGAPKKGPSFELVTVTEIQEELSFDEALLAGGGDNDTLPMSSSPEPVARRPRGRPVTGNALSAAERQARYRSRQAEKTITVTFNRSDIPALKTLLAQADLSQLLPRDELDRLAKAVFDSALSQSL